MLAIFVIILCLVACSKSADEMQDTSHNEANEHGQTHDVSTDDGQGQLGREDAIGKEADHGATGEEGDGYTEAEEPTELSDEERWTHLDLEMPYSLEVFLDELEVPWAIDFAPDGTIFFTERPGRVRVYAEGQLQQEPVITFSDTYHRSEGGLLGLALHPEFPETPYMYIYQTYLKNGSPKNRVMKLVLKGNEAEVDQIIIDDLPGANNHNGGRVRVGPDNKLYITTGEIYQVHLAQQLDNLGGKILRLNLDGSVPDDNPFADSPIYSWGHRNPQGLAWHPATNHLLSSEHGQTAHDEINIIFSGENYGWPLIEGDQSAAEMLSPLVHSGKETWAPSGSAFVTQGPWKHDLLVANLRGTQMIRFVFDYDEVEDRFELARHVYLFKGEYGRIRDVYEHEDGTIYFLTNNRDGRGQPHASDDRIMKLVPLF